MKRIGLGKGKGKGYKNIIPKDKRVHKDSGRGIKQPQKLNIGNFVVGKKTNVRGQVVRLNPFVVKTFKTDGKVIHERISNSKFWDKDSDGDGKIDKTDCKPFNAKKQDELILLKQQPTEQTPIIVDDYPYGFKKTKIKYWVETTNRGQRFVSQTLNPKTNLWNKQKKSTYSQIIVVGKDSKTNYITYDSLSAYSSKEAKDFFNKYGGSFSDYQKKEFKGITGLLKVYDKVEFKIRTKKYKNKNTGEIIEQVPIMEMGNYYEVDDKGNPFNEQKHKQEQKDINIAINKMAVSSSIKEGLKPKEAINVFKRVAK